MDINQKTSPQPVQPKELVQPVPSIQPVQQTRQTRPVISPKNKPAALFKSKHNLILAAGISLSLITVLIAFILVGQRISLFGHAKTLSSEAKISKDNSYIFVSPISAFADGISIIRVTVFMLSNQGLGVSGQTVKLKTSGPLTVSQVKPVTDDYGRAIFDVTSNNPGNYTLSAGTADLSLSQTVSIAFQ